MKTAPLVDAAGQHALTFAWLRDAVAPVSEYGARVFEDIRPYPPGREAAAQARAQLIASVASTLDEARLDALRETLRSIPEASGAIATASMGETLGDVAFLELQRFCDGIARVDALIAGTTDIARIGNDAIRAVARTLEPGRSGNFGFYLADGFGGDVARARIRLADASAEFDAALGRAVQRIARDLGRDDLSGEEFIVMRSDVTGALPAGVRVVREAPTYFLCAIDYDETLLAALQRREDAAQSVAIAEESVRAELSNAIRRHVSELDAATAALGELDVLIAAARFTARYSCSVARIVPQCSIAFEHGRFLPLAGELEREGRAFTPIDVALHDVAVLTGPNMGGKSVCLRTCGFVALCAAFGLPVPAVRAETALFDEIAWLGIGGDDDRNGSLLSSFAKEVVRLRDVLDRDSHRLLVLVDEFARTTTPHEGKALMVAVIERLRERGACGLIATHLSGVAREAGVRHFAVRGLRGIPDRPATGDLHEALAALSASTDYTIAEVGEDAVAGSDAIALAALLGLDPALIAVAHRHLR